MHKIIALASAFLLTSTAMTMAADLIEQSAVPPVEFETPAFTWTGAYVGISGGAGWLDGSTTKARRFHDEQDFDGSVFGAFAGYNWQFGNGIVVGVEGDIEYNSNDEKFFGYRTFGTDWAGSARGRIGYAFDRLMVFGTAGWTMANGHIQYGGIDKSETFSGWTAGAGVDYAVTDKIFVRGEYRYSDFGTKEIVRGMNVDFDQSVVKLGLAVKF
ncbi:outer membrane immunogenic protein [Neorhizobium huautlense]|uniref:Outer membrane immunogenic protein n=1 Tax=Neorhizobium huautlense TaxID=67774 RepID=A0ABT9PXL8_9HYPH|nr:outer membrane protein [Neorhizobium huautlense]MDP9838848.1 outer membrane immunogenic protein [Neorhizobium huautlense]